VCVTGSLRANFYAHVAKEVWLMTSCATKSKMSSIDVLRSFYRMSASGQLPAMRLEAERS